MPNIIKYTPEERRIQQAKVKELAEKAMRLHDAARADNTKSAYESDYRQYEAFCESVGVEPWPAKADVLALWVAEMSERLKATTISRRVYAVSAKHKQRGAKYKDKGYEVDCVNKALKDVLAGLKNTQAQRKIVTRKAKAMVGGITAVMIRALGEESKHAGEAKRVREARNRALLLLGFSGGFRVSEILQLDFADISFDGRGMSIRLINTKTDKSGQVKEIGIASRQDVAAGVCPVAAMHSWIDCLQAQGVTSGRVFRGVSPAGMIATTPNKNGDCMTRMSVNRLIKAAAARGGFDPKGFSTHGMRRGHITEAYLSGVPEERTQNTVRIKTTAVLRSYRESAGAYDGSSSAVKIDVRRDMAEEIAVP